MTESIICLSFPLFYVMRLTCLINWVIFINWALVQVYTKISQKLSLKETSSFVFVCLPFEKSVLLFAKHPKPKLKPGYRPLQNAICFLRNKLWAMELESEERAEN